jgi:hypothetical protein
MIYLAGSYCAIVILKSMAVNGSNAGIVFLCTESRSAGGVQTSDMHVARISGQLAFWPRQATR